MVYEFARPVFRRCGRHLRAQKWFSNSEYTCFRITKIGEDEGRSYPAIVNHANGAEHGRLPLDMGRAPLADWHCDAWACVQKPPILITIRCASRPHAPHTSAGLD